MVVDVVRALPLSCDGSCRCLAAGDGAEGVVEPHFVVEVVETAAVDVVAIFVGIIYFGNKLNLRILLLHLGNGVCPELAGHHLGHVAAEGIHALARPEEEDVGHLRPRVGGRVEVGMATAFVVKAVVEFDGFVPIVHTWCGGKLVVARGLGRIFLVGSLGKTLVAEVGGAQGLGGDVVEIIVGCEATACIIVLTKVAHVGRLGVAVVGACHVVGYEVHNQSQASLVCAIEQGFKFGHTFIDVDG